MFYTVQDPKFRFNVFSKKNLPKNIVGVEAHHNWRDAIKIVNKLNWRDIQLHPYDNKPSAYSLKIYHN